MKGLVDTSFIEKHGSFEQKDPDLEELACAIACVTEKKGENSKEAEANHRHSNELSRWQAAYMFEDL